MPLPCTCLGAAARSRACIGAVASPAAGRRRDTLLVAVGTALLVTLAQIPQPSLEPGRWELAISSGLAKSRKKKGKTPPPAPLPQSAYEDALDQQKPAIEECVMELGIKQGVLSVRLDIKVLVNRSGQAFGTDLQVTQTGGDQLAMSTCIKTALGLARFPPSRSALTELHRQWTFSAQ